MTVVMPKPLTSVLSTVFLISVCLIIWGLLEKLPKRILTRILSVILILKNIWKTSLEVLRIKDMSKPSITEDVIYQKSMQETSLSVHSQSVQLLTAPFKDQQLIS